MSAPEPVRWLSKEEKHDIRFRMELSSAHRVSEIINFAETGFMSADSEVSVDVVAFSDVCPASRDPAFTTKWQRTKFAYIGTAVSTCGEWRITVCCPIGLDAMSTDDPNGDDISRGSPHVFVTRLKLKHGETINGGQLYQTYELAGLTWFGRSEPSDLTWNLGYPTASSVMQFASLTAASYGYGAHSIGAFAVDFQLFVNIKSCRCFPLEQLNTEPLHIIASHLNLLDIYHLAQAAPALRERLQALPAPRMRTILSPFFEDAEKFLGALDTFGGVISGSTVLAVLCPGNWKPCDIDIIITQAEYTLFKRYLGSEGYVMNKDKSFDAWPDHAIDIKVRYRFARWERGDKKLDLFIPDNVAPANFVFTYHTTTVMNFYASGSLTCCFPHLTFRGHFQLNYVEHTDSKEQALEKYVRRGYTLNHHAPLFIPVDGVPEPARNGSWRDYGASNTTFFNLRREQIKNPMWRCQVKF